MIAINLLPGAAKKGKGRGASFSLGALTRSLSSRVRDPYMVAAVLSVLLAIAGVGSMHVSQSARAGSLGELEEKALRDSSRFAMVLKARHKAEARRDSVVRQLAIIRSIDNDRFVWPHILDEVSRALPPYTWLKSISQTVAESQAAAPPDAGEKDDDGKRDPVPSVAPLRFRLVGNTVDIQALTRFMKLLETSPFVQNVQLARSELVMVDGKEVTEFQLDAEYERPERSGVASAPVSLQVR